MVNLSPQQSGHEHEMTLREISKYCRHIDCQLCGDVISGSQAHCCVDCSYFIHKECTGLPVEIHHPFHPEHSLVRSTSDSVVSACQICGVHFCNPRNKHAWYSCDKCGFNLHMNCAVSTLHLEEVSHDNILHFLDEHPLKDCRLTGEFTAVECEMCGVGPFRPEDRFYGCLKCRFFMHERCSKFPKEINLHSFHEHSLTFSYNAFDGALAPCQICSEACFSYVYKCRICRIALHVRCAVLALLPFLIEGESSTQGLEHSLHDHPLSYFYVESQSRIPCQFCQNRIKGSFYGCLGCRFFMHKSCTEVPLPQVVKHPLYPQHSLTLTEAPLDHKSCNFCPHRITNLSYRCDSTNLQVHIGCANGIKISALNEDGQILEKQYPGHEHPLTLLNRIGAPTVECKNCGYSIEDGPAYYCCLEKCRIWLHKGCGDLRIEKHPLHPGHSLHVIVGINGGGIESHCSVCCGDIIEGRLISCAECDFKMDDYCAYRRQTLKHPRHEHTLAYLGKSISEGTNNNCGVCGKRCKFDFYHCLTCNFDMHYFCSLLPPTVKSGRHVHELSLLDVYLEDDSGEYYCVLCGQARHPRHGIYYCGKCEFISHIECIIPSEIENKALFELEEEITDLKAEIDIEKENLVAAKKNLEEVEKRMKALETQYTTSTQKLSIWKRNA